MEQQEAGGFAPCGRVESRPLPTADDPFRPRWMDIADPCERQCAHIVDMLGFLRPLHPHSRWWPLGPRTHHLRPAQARRRHAPTRAHEHVRPQGRLRFRRSSQRSSAMASSSARATHRTAVSSSCVSPRRATPRPRSSSRLARSSAPRRSPALALTNEPSLRTCSRGLWPIGRKSSQT